jgi:hypothetical protein
VTGTLLNIAAVLFGGTLGLLVGARLPDRIRQTVIAGLGLFTAALGLRMFTESGNPIIVLGSLLAGGILGELLDVEGRLQGLGERLQARFAPPSDREAEGGGASRFVRGFLTASLVFCVGPMTILGSIQDGLSGDFNLLAIKSVLDGFASLAFASTLGVGVLFSTLVILVFQGGISLMASSVQAWFSQPMMNEMTAVGGLLLVSLAVSSLLQIKIIRVGNFLPALLIAPLIVWLLASLRMA